MINKLPELNELRNTYDRVKYLSDFQNHEKHEEFLYQIYEPILQIVATSSRQFSDFSQGNYDTLTRLKWKWLGSRLDFINQGPYEEAKVAGI